MAGTNQVFRISQVEVEFGSGVSSLEVLLPIGGAQGGLRPNYFIMLRGCRTDGVSGGPASQTVRVIEDPFATGDLGTNTSGNNYITLGRGTTTGTWKGTLTCVECLSSSSQNGFRLVDVLEINMPATASSGDQSVNTALNSGAAWTARGRVTPIGGFNGGGHIALSVDDTKMEMAGCILDTTAAGEVSLTRTTEVAGDLDLQGYTVYVVEWGAQWTAQKFTYSGNVDNAWNATASIDTAVASANSMILAQGITGRSQPEASWGSFVFHAGDGSTTATSITSVAIAIADLNPQAGQALGWVLTHANLATDWAEIASGTTNARSITVDAPAATEYYGTNPQGFAYTLGNRAALGGIAGDSANSGAMRETIPYIFRHDASANVSVDRDSNASTSFFGWVQSVDFGGVTDDGFEVPSDGGNPKQGILFIDPHWDPANNNILSVTTEDGVSLGPVVPANANIGRAVGVQEGNPSSTSERDFITQNGGKIEGGAGYLYRKSGEDNYLAFNALTTLWRPYAFDATADHAAASIAYSKAYNRIVCARIENRTTIQIRYRDAEDGDLNEWNSTSITVEDAKIWPDGHEGLDLVELDDGALLLAYSTATSEDALFGGGSDDVNLLRSTDGGLTWVVVAEQVISQTQAIPTATGGGTIALASSGDWLCLTRIETRQDENVSSSNDLQVYWSPDKGASWAKGSDVSIATQVSSTSDNHAGGWPFSLIGNPVGNGQFVLARTNGLSVQQLSALGGQGFEQFSSQTLTGPTSAKVWQMCHVDTPSGIMLMCWYESDDADQAGEVYGLLGRYASLTSEWTELGRIGNVRGAGKWMPMYPSAAWCGHFWVVYGARYDHTAGGSDVSGRQYGPYMMQGGGWDSLAWHHTRNDVGMSDYMLRQPIVNWLLWSAPLGRPSEATESQWTFQSTGSPDTTWTPLLQGLTCDSTEAAYYEITDIDNGSSDTYGASPTGTAFHWEAKVVSQRSEDTPQDAEGIGLRIKSANSSIQTAYWDVTLRLGTTQLALWDNGNDTELISVTTAAATVNTEYRLHATVATTDATESNISLHYRQVADTGRGAWNSYGTFTASHAGSHTNQQILMGILAAQSGSATGQAEIQFSHLNVSAGTGMGMSRDTALLTTPGDWIGAPMSGRPISVRDKVRVKWGGSGVFAGDAWTGSLDYSLGKRNLIQDSQSIYWQSAGITENALVFGALSGSTTSPWFMDGLALMGTVDRTIAIQFSDTNSWSAPTEEFVLSADIAEVVIDEVDGNMVRLSAASGSVLPKKGFAIGQYIQITSGDAAGKSFSIVTNVDDTDNWYQLDDVDLDAKGVAAGNGAVVYADSMLWRSASLLRYKFFRLVTPESADTDGTPASGKHRIGAVVPGVWFDFDVPLDWTHRNSESPNNTVSKTRGGRSYVYEEGPAQRVMDGIFVGDAYDDQQILSMRDIAREIHRYNKRPVVLVLDMENRFRENVIYGRIDSGSEFDVAGYEQDSNGRWRPMGDLRMVITEEP